MKNQLLTLTTLTLLFLLSAPPTVMGTCYFPAATSLGWDSNISCNSCENSGWKLNYVNSSNYQICVDKNCEQMRNTGTTYQDVTCIKCKSGFYREVHGRIAMCAFCPQGATCDGYTIQCGEGYYGADCKPCHSSCKTCSGEKANNCTSCSTNAYLSGNTCIDCPANATCDGSSYFSCNTGYSKSDGNCVADQQDPVKTNTVNSCPSRMTLSADGCCCINK